MLSLTFIVYLIIFILIFSGFKAGQNNRLFKILVIPFFLALIMVILTFIKVYLIYKLFVFLFLILTLFLSYSHLGKKIYRWRK